MTASPPTRKSAMARLPPLNWLRAFEASARALSFTAAAQELNMTQSAVSQQIKSLESALGRLLFVRRVRGLELTDEGRGYLPTVQAAFAMLACARIGAIHCVVFGGFASGSLASRIDDASPKVIVSADAGSRGGKVVAYKPLLDEAIRLSSHKPEAVLLVDRSLATMDMTPGRDLLWADLRAKYMHAQVPCEALDSTAISYTIYTS
eukprot:gene26278-47543_t